MKIKKSINGPLRRQWVANIAALQALAIAVDGQHFSVASAAALGDGGGARYVYSAASVDVADGKTIVDATGIGVGRFILADGFKASAAGAVTRTQQGKLGERVSVFDFMSGAMRNAIQGGDINQDITAAVLAACISGASRVDFCGVTAVCGVVTLNSVANLNIFGNGARLRKPAGSGSNSLIFNLKGGCNNVKIYGFDDLDGGYDSTNLSTGSNPVILVGDQTGGGDGGTTNQRIKIFQNGIRRSNWAGIVVYGRSNNAATITPTNKDIEIFSNNIQDCGGSGIFIYKNAKDVTVSANLVDGVITDGIVFDTMAATDTVASEEIDGVTITKNKVRNFGKLGQGIGILAKGKITNIAISSNSVRDGTIQPAGAYINYGILLNKDANPVVTAPSNFTINGNPVKNIQSTLTGIGIQVGEGCANGSVVGNPVSDCPNAGIFVNQNVRNVSILSNAVKSCGNATYGYRFEGSAGNEIHNLTAMGNTFDKGTSTAVGGFKFTYVIDGIERGNIAPDFSASAVNVTNSTRFTSTREFSGTAIPAAGTFATGDIVVNTNTTTASPVDRWRCVVGGTPGTWRPSSWIVGKAPTASRPVLTASDIGVQFLDTTLNANGKPIWWNGVAWIDATGAVV